MVNYKHKHVCSSRKGPAEFKISSILVSAGISLVSLMHFKSIQLIQCNVETVCIFQIAHKLLGGLIWSVNFN